jgi:hypothetical protein
MNGTSGFQEVPSSTSRSSAGRFLDEQRHQFGKSSWHLLRTHDLIALSTGISSKREKVPDLFLKPRKIWSGVFQIMKAREVKMSKVLRRRQSLKRRYRDARV